MGKSTPVVLVTGATGTFGRLLIDELLRISPVDLVLLVRGSSTNAAHQRIVSQNKIGDETVVYCADLSRSNLGLTHNDYYDLASRVTHILHSAANTRFNLSLEDARLQNVATTKHILEFAMHCNHLTRFVHMSSALVAGKRTGIILEEELMHTSGFTNTYQESKYEAEMLVRGYSSELPIVILRPPFIITKPHNSYRGPTSLLAHLLKIIKEGYLPLVPGYPQNTFDMVDGGEIARLVIQLLFKEELLHLTYHLSNDTHALTIGKVKELLEDYMKAKLNIEFCGELDEFRRRVWWRTFLHPKQWVVYKKATTYLQEAAFPKIYSSKNLFEELNMSTMESRPEEVFSTMLKW